MGTYHKVAESKDLTPGKAKAVQIGDVRIAVFNVDGTYYAVSDTCTHRGGPLSEGALEGTTIICPWHGGTFDVRTGQNVGPPAPVAVTCYKVRVEGDEIQVELP